MLTPIVCPTCGLSLVVAPIYHEIRKKRLQKMYESGEIKTLPSHATIDPNFTTGEGSSNAFMSDILDALKVYKCCRTHLVTSLNFSDYY